MAAIGGGAIALVGNILHPRESGQLDDAESLLDVASRSSVWVADHFVILSGLLLLLGAFHGLTRSITGEPGRTWARFAWGVAIIGVVFGLALMLTEAVAMAKLADTWAGSSGAEKDLALAAGSAVFELSLTLFAGGMLFFFGATPVLYGVAMLGSDDYPSPLGWAGVVFGSASVVAGAIQVFTGFTTTFFIVLFPIVSVAITLWIIYTGVVMWRKSAHE